MTERNSSNTSDVVTDRELNSVLLFWRDLDRGWQAVALGLIILGVIVSGIEVPW